METITLAKGGTAERVVKVEEIQIPDLWHLAMFIQDHEDEIYERVGHNHLALDNLLAGKPAGRPKWSEAILETWHLCHDLLRTVQERK
jgi:hypothetical protein